MFDIGDPFLWDIGLATKFCGIRDSNKVNTIPGICKRNVSVYYTKVMWDTRWDQNILRNTVNDLIFSREWGSLPPFQWPSVSNDKKFSDIHLVSRFLFVFFEKFFVNGLDMCLYMQIISLFSEILN